MGGAPLALRALRALALAVLAGAAARAHLRRPARLNNTRPEMWMSSTQLIGLRGRGAETHTVRTEDGYVLTAHRIGRARARARAGAADAADATPLLMGHGLCSSDEQWLVRSEDNLVFMLADMGFDIWLANYRGSFYSKKHETLSAKSHEFWDFSWHENGVFDQAALVDYVLAVTGKPSLLVLGHSMSSTSQVVLLAERPEYSAKVRASVLLAPPVYFARASGLLKLGGQLFRTFPFMRDASARNLVNDMFAGLDRPFPQACFDFFGRRDGKLEPHCSRLLDFVMGTPLEPVDKELLQLLMYHYPAGSSIRQVMHYAQCIAGGRFFKYDFGPTKNRQKYGVPHPPEYNLSNINSPVYLHYSLGDRSVNYKDVEAFSRDLRPGVLKRLRRIPAEGFNHIDYLIASDVYDLLYKYVIEDLMKHV